MNVGGNNTTDGSLSEAGINYFVERARGGTGMICTGAVRVTREFERDPRTIPVWMLFADNLAYGRWISLLSERCHDYDTKVCIQLTAGGGRLAGPYLQNHGLAVGPSENPCFVAPFKNTRALTKEEIKKFVIAFEQAARIIKNAGADAIQIHGHQGYMIDQFTTSLWNHREDEYGGSLENRLRFSKELIEAIKRGAGSDFPIIYRFGLTHHLCGGRSIEEGLEMAKLLESYGCDALDIDSGCYENNYYPHPPTTIPVGSFAYLAEEVKKIVSIPVISSTRIGYPDIAEDILSKGQADYVSLGRPLIADPYWCNKAKEGKIEDIRPCLACHEGCLRRLMAYKKVSCAVNPMAGDEEYLRIEPSDKKKNVIVVGGGISGIVSAIVCQKRGHKVTLFEKSNELGGNFKEKQLPDFKDDYRKYIAYLKRQLMKTDVELKMGHEVSLEELKNVITDVIINATGASFKSIVFEGIDNSKIVTPFALYENKSYQNQVVAIIGGGLVGVEAALNVVKHGGQPFIVEKMGQIAQTAYPVNRQHLEFLLKKFEVPVYLNATVVKVEGGTLLIKTNELEAQKSLKFDLIAECVGMKANTIDLIDKDNIISVGDAICPDNVMNAVWTAYRKCRLV